MLPEALADQFLELYFAWQLSDKPNASINKHEKLGTIKKKKRTAECTTNSKHVAFLYKNHYHRIRSF